MSPPQSFLPLFLILFSATGCSDDAPVASAPDKRTSAAKDDASAPPKATAELEPTSLGAKCVPVGCWINFQSEEVVFHGTNKGVTTLRQGGQKLVSKFGERVRATLDLKPVVEREGIATILDALRKETYLSGELDGFEVVGMHGIARGAVRVPYSSLKAVVEKHFVAAIQPAPMAREVRGEAVLIVPFRKDFGLDQIGDPKLLSDVRFIAWSQTRTRKAGSCGTYRDDSGKKVNVSKSAIDLDVQLYDLKTGSLAAERTFEGPSGGCGSVHFSTSSFGKPRYKKAVAWLHQQQEALR